MDRIKTAILFYAFIAVVLAWAIHGFFFAPRLPQAGDRCGPEHVLVVVPDLESNDLSCE